MLLHVLIFIVLVALAFAAVRALTIAWGFHHRFAAATAVAMAGAFAIGALSPIAFSTDRPATVGASAIVAPVAVTPSPVPIADLSRAVQCPAGAALAKTSRATGHVDYGKAGKAEPVGAPASIDVAAGSPLVLGGWLLLAGAEPKVICAIVDGHPTAAGLRYGLARIDVSQALNLPKAIRSGFVATLTLARGTHMVSVGAVEADGHTVDVLGGGIPAVRVK